MIIEIQVNVIDGEQADRFEAMGMGESIEVSTAPFYFKADKLDGFLPFGDNILFYVSGVEHVTNYTEDTYMLFQDVLMNRVTE